MSIRSDEKSVVLLKIEILWRELIMKFSDRLKGLREKNDMTQEQLARAIGSAREAVSRTLKGLVKGGCVELFRGGVRVVDRKELYKKI